MGDRMTFNNSPGVGFPVVLRQSHSQRHNIWIQNIHYKHSINNKRLSSLAVNASLLERVKLGLHRHCETHWFKSLVIFEAAVLFRKKSNHASFSILWKAEISHGLPLNNTFDRWQNLTVWKPLKATRGWVWKTVHIRVVVILRRRYCILAKKSFTNVNKSMAKWWQSQGMESCISCQQCADSCSQQNQLLPSNSWVLKWYCTNSAVWKWCFPMGFHCKSKCLNAT